MDEPPSGMYVRARYADHHTAGYIWCRDDAEGHPASELPGGVPAQVWWSHDWSKWMSWEQIVRFVAKRPAKQRLVLEPFFGPASMPGCRPDGIHSLAHCRFPGAENK